MSKQNQSNDRRIEILLTSSKDIIKVAAYDALEKYPRDFSKASLSGGFIAYNRMELLVNFVMTKIKEELSELSAEDLNHPMFKYEIESRLNDVNRKKATIDTAMNKANHDAMVASGKNPFFEAFKKAFDERAEKEEGSSNSKNSSKKYLNWDDLDEKNVTTILKEVYAEAEMMYERTLLSYDEMIKQGKSDDWEPNIKDRLASAQGNKLGIIQDSMMFLIKNRFINDEGFISPKTKADVNNSVKGANEAQTSATTTTTTTTTNPGFFSSAQKKRTLPPEDHGQEMDDKKNHEPS